MNTSITSCTSCSVVISYLSVLFQIRCNEPISTSIKLLQWNKFEIRLKIKSYIANNQEPKQNKSTEFSLLDLHHFPYSINYLKAVGCCNPHDSVGPINIITKKMDADVQYSWMVISREKKNASNQFKQQFIWWKVRNDARQQWWNQTKILSISRRERLQVQLVIIIGEENTG